MLNLALSLSASRTAVLATTSAERRPNVSIGEVPKRCVTETAILSSSFALGGFSGPFEVVNEAPIDNSSFHRHDLAKASVPALDGFDKNAYWFYRLVVFLVLVL
jgi:hypothetical protein